MILIRILRKVKRISMLLLLSLLIVLLFFSSIGLTQTVLFQDDFEDGNADDWILESGWQVEDEDGNFILSGTGHSFAKTGDTSWRNYRFKTKLKLMDNNSSVHVNYRVYNNCERYFIDFYSQGLFLSKTAPCETQTELVSVNVSYDTNKWYTIEVAGDEGNIKVYVDNILKIDYTDNDPLYAGSISFETLDNSHVHFDDVVVATNDPISETKWVSTGGPLGGLGYDVRIHPANKNIMFVTDNNAGVVRSDNAGGTWYQTNSGISIRSGHTGDAINIFSLTIDPNDPNTIWAGTNGEGSAFGVFKSTDGGDSWAMKKNGITLEDAEGLIFRGFTIQKGNSNIVYVQSEVETSEQGREFILVKGRVYKTNDGGESWQLIWEGNNLARYLIIDPANSEVLYMSTGIFDREAYNSDCNNGISGGVGVLKSTDGGETWASINNGLTDLYVGSLRMHPSNSKILFAATGNGACSGQYEGNIVSGLFRTQNGGSSWSKVIGGAISTTVNFSPSNPDIVYAGDANAFYRSEDGGLTWSTFDRGGVWGPPGIRAGFPIDVTIDPDNPYLLYANNYGGGVFRSTDGAETWEDWSKGYSGAEIHKVCIPAANTSTVFAIGRSGPFVSYNYENDWKGIANGDAKSNAEWYSVAVHPVNSNIILITDEHQGVIFRSTDGGNDFTEVFRHSGADASNPDQRQGFKTLVFSPSNPNVVYAGLARDRKNILSSSPYGTVICKSTDAGVTFSEMTSDIDGYNVNELIVDSNNVNIVYAATSNGVYKSTDGAKSYIHFHSLGNPNIEALSVAFQQTNYLIAGEIENGIWISEDDGTTWTGPHNGGFNSSNPYITAIIFDPDNHNTVYASDLYSGIYQSADKGNTWSPFPDSEMSGLTVRAVKDIVMNKEVIYGATQGGGVFRYGELAPALTPTHALTPTPQSTVIPTPIPTSTPTQEPIEAGKIYGYVKDVKGAPITSARLTLKGKKIKIGNNTSSGKKGYFEFTDLKADTYTIIARKKGYKKSRQKVKLGEKEKKEIVIKMKKSR